MPRFISQRNLKVCFVYMNGDEYCFDEYVNNDFVLVYVCASLVMFSLLLLLSKLEKRLIVFSVILTVSLFKIWFS